MKIIFLAIAILLLMWLIGCAKNAQEPIANPIAIGCKHLGWIHKGYTDKNVFIEQDTTVLTTVCGDDMKYYDSTVKNQFYPVPCTSYDSAGWFVWK
jgi:hypothetical protein